MPPTATAIDLGITWASIVGGVNAFGPALALPVVIGVGAALPGLQSLAV